MSKNRREGQDKYRINILKIITFCADRIEDKSIQKDITELYRKGSNNEDMELYQKQINETNVVNGNQMKNTDVMKFELIKYLLDIVLGSEMEIDDNGNTYPIDPYELAWNTLSSMGIIEKIN
jgi:hypothetical protein